MVDVSGPDAPPPSTRASVTDRRALPTGVLPRQLQTWLMAGIAGVIVLIILITGHPEPPAPTRTAPAAVQPALAPADRIRSYQQQLAQEEARQRQALARATPESDVNDPRAMASASRTSSAALEDRQRASQSLAADNVAFSRRPSGQQPYAQTRDSGGDRLAAMTATPSTPALDQLEQALTRALALTAPRPGAASPTPSTPTISNATAAPSVQAPAASARTDASPSTADQDQADASTSIAREHPAPGPRFPLLEGTVIEAVLLNRLDGTYAGPVMGLVTTPVYSHDRQHVLVPAGARVLGAASPVQGWGDARLAVSFHRLLMPDGHTYALDRFKGLDAVGATGLRDRVNRHYAQVFGASLAIGALSGLAQYHTRTGFGVTDFSDEFRQSAGASLATAASRVLDRYLNVLPTVTIHEGHRMRVYLTGDLDLPAYDVPVPGGLR